MENIELLSKPSQKIISEEDKLLIVNLLSSRDIQRFVRISTVCKHFKRILYKDVTYTSKDFRGGTAQSRNVFVSYQGGTRPAIIEYLLLVTIDNCW